MKKPSKTAKESKELHNTLGIPKYKAMKPETAMEEKKEKGGKCNCKHK